MQLAPDLFRPSLDETLTQLATISRNTSEQISRAHKAKYNQYFTEGEVARQMAKMLTVKAGATIGDHGAGTGVLCASVLAYSLAKQQGEAKPFNLKAYEIDERLHEAFGQSMDTVAFFAQGLLNAEPNVELKGDFSSVVPELLSGQFDGFLDAAILNPPYQKLNQQTEFAKQLKANVVACPNLYAAFIVLSIEMLKPGGELVAIVPRSFANGTYFKSFRQWLKAQGSIDWFVRYKGRSNLFRNDNVLQENVTFRFTKGVPQVDRIRVSLCKSPEHPPIYESMVPVDDILPQDSDMIFIPLSQDELTALHNMRAMPLSAKGAGLVFSTGKFEDFRMREKLYHEAPNTDWAPVLYSQHWLRGDKSINWESSVQGKPACVVVDEDSSKKLLPRGNYVLIKRISANDDASGRCHPCAVFEDSDIPGEQWAIDNHVQVITGVGGASLTKKQAELLVEFLLSDPIDHVLRVISGTTQLNKNDLLHIRYDAQIMSNGEH